jgi:hypothetical protein
LRFPAVLPKGVFNKKGAKMQTTKQEVSDLLNRLPDDCTLEDVQYHLYVLQKIERGLKDIEEGRVYTQEEVEKKMSKWLEK